MDIVIVKLLKSKTKNLDFVIPKQWILEARLLVDVNTVDYITTFALLQESKVIFRT